MKQYCKHCEERVDIKGISSIEIPNGVFAKYILECGHNLLFTWKDHEERERKRKTLLSRFKNWVGIEEIE